MEMVERIEWLGQAAVKITAPVKADGELTIFIDPYRLTGGEPADLVLVTHAHQDHCSPGDLAKVVGTDTVLVATQDCAAKLDRLTPQRLVSLQPGEEATLKGIRIEAVPAYNVKKKKFHPKENAWVGYILTIDDVRVYHFGDTERIPEMKELSCDIALLPLGQTYTMNSVEEAAAAVRDVKASIAIPIHYGMFEGTAEDAARLEKLLTGKVKVVIKATGHSAQ